MHQSKIDGHTKLDIALLHQQQNSIVNILLIKFFVYFPHSFVQVFFQNPHDSDTCEVKHSDEKEQKDRPEVEDGVGGVVTHLLKLVGEAALVIVIKSEEDIK